MDAETPVSHQEPCCHPQAEKRKRDETDEDSEDEAAKATSMEVEKRGSSSSVKCGMEEEASEEKTVKYLRQLSRQKLKKNNAVVDKMMGEVR